MTTPKEAFKLVWSEPGFLQMRLGHESIFEIICSNTEKFKCLLLVFMMKYRAKIIDDKIETKFKFRIETFLSIFVLIPFLLHCRLMISFQHLVNWRLLASRDPCRIEGLSWPILQEHPRPHFQHHPLLEDLFGSWKIEISRYRI